LRSPTLFVAVLATAVLCLAAPAWSDTTLCVHQSTGTCPAGSTDDGSDLQSALSDAGSDGQPTTVDVLAGTYSGPFLSLSNEPLSIAGAGVGQTILRGGSTVLEAGCASTCEAGTFAIHDLSVQMTSAGSTGLTLFSPFDAHDVAVGSTASSGTATGVDLTGTATLERAAVTLPQTGGPSTAVHVQGQSHASDLTLAADVGVAVDATGTLSLGRAAIDADVAGVTSLGAGTALDDALIRLTGTGARGVTSVAGAVTASLSVLNSTIRATGTNDVGVYVQSTGASSGNRQGVANVTNTILWGETTPEDCVIAGPGGPLPSLTMGYDDVDPAGTNSCVATIGHPLAVTPGFVSGTDAHLRFDSPLVDQGSPAVATPAGTTDLDGDPRLVDGDGNGAAVRDVGAYEYQRRPPDAGANAPDTAALGQPVTFDASASFDPDPGDSLSYGWSFGDGANAATAVASHAFASTGVHTATVNVTDSTGLITTAQVTVTIPGAPALSAPPTVLGPTTTAKTTTTTSATPAARPPAGAPALPHATPARLTVSVGRATIPRLVSGLSVAATSSVPGHVTLILAHGTHALVTRHIAFTRAGRQTVVLRVSKRLAKALRRTTRLSTTLRATLAGSTTVALRRLVLHR
jgi:hypothetical protein